MLREQTALTDTTEMNTYGHVENPHTRFICCWIDRMSRLFGWGVQDNRRPNTVTAVRWGWDWGQAICALQYGPFWSDYITKNHIDDADEETVRLARDWEAGEWPEWAWTENRPNNRPDKETI